MQGRIDYGGLAPEPKHVMAKSALFCLATEINGNKAFPLAYILTAGIKAPVLAEVMKKCISAVEQANGKVLSISFDGLPANLAAVASLGASLNVEEGVSSKIQFTGSDGNHHHCNVIPDACHMMKLLRNNWEKIGVIYNGDKKVFNIIKIHTTNIITELISIIRQLNGNTWIVCLNYKNVHNCEPPIN